MRPALLLFLALPVLADTSLPSPAPGSNSEWQGRCVAALQRAKDEIARDDAGFVSGEIRTQDKLVRFDAKVADREHARFFAGKPAHYFVTVEEKQSKAPGELGGSVGTAKDGQASFGVSRWTKHRYAVIDVQIGEGKRVHRFGRVFKAAVDECLR
jgi:hypothetical protein